MKKENELGSVDKEAVRLAREALHAKLRKEMIGEDDGKNDPSSSSTFSSALFQSVDKNIRVTEGPGKAGHRRS